MSSGEYARYQQLLSRTSPSPPPQKWRLPIRPHSSRSWRGKGQPSAEATDPDSAWPTPQRLWGKDRRGSPAALHTWREENADTRSSTYDQLDQSPSATRHRRRGHAFWSLAFGPLLRRQLRAKQLHEHRSELHQHNYWTTAHFARQARTMDTKKPSQ